MKSPTTKSATPRSRYKQCADRVLTALPALEWVKVPPLGSGTFGHVYLARVGRRASPDADADAVTTATDSDWSASMPPRTNVAVKVLDWDHVRHEEILCGLALLRGHPNLARLHRWQPGPCEHYLVFEYIDGIDLYTLVTERYANSRIPEPRARRLFQQLASAIAFCHEHGVAHRDLKLENVMVTEQDHLVLIDFGLAFVLDATRGVASSDLPTASATVWRATREKPHGTAVPLYRASSFRDNNMRVGSLPYAAPEVHLGMVPTPADFFASDVYSFGVVLYTATVGLFPADHQHLVGACSTMLRYVTELDLLHSVDEPTDVARIVNDPSYRRVLLATWPVNCTVARKAVSTDLAALLERLMHPIASHRPRIATVLREDAWLAPSPAAPGASTSTGSIPSAGAGGSERVPAVPPLTATRSARRSL